MNDNDTTSYGSNYPLLVLSGQQQQSFSYLNDDTYTALILEEAEKLYNQFITNLTNSILAAAADVRESSLPLPPNNNTQKLIQRNGNAYYETKGSRYLNQEEIYTNDQATKLMMIRDIVNNTIDRRV